MSSLLVKFERILPKSFNIHTKLQLKLYDCSKSRTQLGQECIRKTSLVNALLPRCVLKQ